MYFNQINKTNNPTCENNRDFEHICSLIEPF